MEKTQLGATPIEIPTANIDLHAPQTEEQWVFKYPGPGLGVEQNDVTSLAPSNWLRDGVINFAIWSEVFNRRDFCEGNKHLSGDVFCYDTYFLSLLGKGCSTKNCTKNVNIFEKRLLVIPVNITELRTT